MGRPRLSTRDVALVAVFAALSVVVCKVVPGIPIVGVPDASIKFDAALAPIYGLILGPYLGFLAALIGGFVAAGSVFSILTSFCTAVSALVAGLLTRERYSVRKHNVNGWVLAAVILGVLILGWYATWVGQRAPSYPILHFAGLLAILVSRGRIAKSFQEGDMSLRGWRVRPYPTFGGILIVVSAYMFSRPYLSQIELLPFLSLPLYLLGGIMILYGVFGGGRGGFVFAVCLASYVGVIADHMLGNLIFISVVDVLIPLEVIEKYFLKPHGLPDIPSLFMYMIPVSAVERLLLTVIATLFGIGLVLTLRRAGLLPQQKC